MGRVVGRVVTVLAAALLAVAACFIKPGPPQIGGGDGGVGDGGGGDGTTGDGNTSGDAAGDGSTNACAGPHDDWNGGGSACGTWGTELVLGGAAAIGRGGGTLNTSVGSAASNSKCTSNSFDLARGVSIKVDQAIGTTMNDSTFIHLAFTGAYVRISIDQLASLTVNPTCTGAASFTTGAAFGALFQHFRFTGVQIGANATVTVEHGSNGTQWQSLGTCTLTSVTIASATVEFGAVAGGGSAQRTAQFDDFTTCALP
jgi:hypothetical protein